MKSNSVTNLSAYRRSRWLSPHGPYRPRLSLAARVVAAGIVLTVAIVSLGPEKALDVLRGRDQAPTQPAPNDTVSGISFALCGAHPFYNCVVDGDTFYLQREPIRVEDIDAPETHPSRCAFEARLGARATTRLNELLNAGPFQLEQGETRDRDPYGRRLRIVLRNGQSIGAILVSEGLARRWTGHRMPWCDAGD